MSKRTMVILRGLPGSGKSTLAAQMVKENHGRWVRINRDDLRRMLVGPGNDPHFAPGKGGKEGLARDLKNSAITQAFQAGFDVLLDDTHLVTNTVKALHALAESWGDVEVQELPLNVDPAVCIDRDARREGFAKVGEAVIKDMAKHSGIGRDVGLCEQTVHYPPRAVQSGKPVTQNPALPKAIICDLDGTLALLNGRNPYDASSCHLDLPNEAVISAVKAMKAAEYHIIFVSGRESKYMGPTLQFLDIHIGSMSCDLHMRKSGDMRKDSIVKRELFEQCIAGRYFVSFVLDDRNQVVDMWRSLGLTCFQVAPGNF